MAAYQVMLVVCDDDPAGELTVYMCTVLTRDGDKPHMFKSVDAAVREANRLYLTPNVIGYKVAPWLHHFIDSSYHTKFYAGMSLGLSDAD